MAQETRTQFQRYLTDLGDEQAAKQLDMPRRTVKSWRLGDRVPRPAQARRIVEATPLTMDDIYAAHEQPAA